MAFENEIYNKRFNQTLLNVYNDPNLDNIKILYDQLIDSYNHFDREVAFWLGFVLEQTPAKIDLHDLAVEMREMEVLLFNILWRVNADSQRDLNDWLNYLVNAAQSIDDGFGLDAKILVSLALESSITKSVEQVKKDPSLAYTINVLQKETTRLFNEIKRLPLKLKIPEERLNIIVELQRILIDLLQKRFFEDPEKELKTLMNYSVQKLEEYQRYLMSSDIDLSRTKKEIDIASEQLEWQVTNTTDAKTRNLAKELVEKISTLRDTFLDSIPSTP